LWYTRANTMADSKKNGFAWPILVAQLLLGGIIFVALVFYPQSPKAALVVIYILLCGVLYFSLQGLKRLWKK